MCQEQKPFKVFAFLEMHVSAFLKVWSVIFFYFFEPVFVLFYHWHLFLSCYVWPEENKSKTQTNISGF